MKKNNFIFALVVVAILFAFVSSALALSDKEYKQMMKNSDFAKADKALNQAYKNAKSSLSGELWKTLKDDQMSWIKKDRDFEANLVIKEMSVSRVQAYATVTAARAEYINEYVNAVSQADLGSDLPNDDSFASDLPEDFIEDLPSNSEQKSKKTAKNFSSADEASTFLSERLINLDKINPNEEIIYLDSEIELNGEECFEFSSEFNFSETGRYAVSKSGKVYEYINEEYVLVK